jgi:hypothetical protein
MVSKKLLNPFALTWGINKGVCPLVPPGQDEGMVPEKFLTLFFYFLFFPGRRRLYV